MNISIETLQQLAKADPEAADQLRSLCYKELHPFNSELNENVVKPDLNKEILTEDDVIVPELPISIDYRTGIYRTDSEWINTYIGYASSVSPLTPVDFHESAALWLASTAIARRLVIPMAFGKIYPNLFIVWIAETTLFRKSTALNIAHDLARETMPYLLAPQDITPEALISYMAGEEPTNIEKFSKKRKEMWEKRRNYSAQRGCIIDEISGLIAGTKKDYNAGTIESLLRLFDCEPSFTRCTLGRGEIEIKDSYLSLLGATTPTMMGNFLKSDNMWTSGFWPRFAILSASKRPDWLEATSTQRPSTLVDSLSRLLQRLPSDTKWPEPPRALNVRIQNEAMRRWAAYNKALSYDLITPDLDEKLKGTYGRLPVLALKIATILAALEWSSNEIEPTIDERRMVNAIVITETWRRNVHQALSYVTSAGVNKITDRILMIIAKHSSTGITMRDISRSMRDQSLKVIQNGIDELLNAELIVSKTESTNNTGPKTKRYYPNTN